MTSLPKNGEKDHVASSSAANLGGRPRLRHPRADAVAGGAAGRAGEDREFPVVHLPGG